MGNINSVLLFHHVHWLWLYGSAATLSPTGYYRLWLSTVFYSDDWNVLLRVPFVVTAVVSFQHLQFSNMPRLPLCCGESHSLCPVAFGHGPLHVSPLQSKHQLVSSAASVSTQAYWLLVYRLTAVWRGLKQTSVLWALFIAWIAFWKIRLGDTQPISASQVTDSFLFFFFLILWILLVWTDFRLHHLIL